MKAKNKLTKVKVQKVFNASIVHRDERCVICGKTDNLQCSHFYPTKANQGIRFHPDNAHTMCAGCHIDHHQRDPLFYSRWMARHNNQALEHLAAIRKRPLKYRQDVLEKIVELCNREDYSGLVTYIDSMVAK